MRVVPKVYCEGSNCSKRQTCMNYRIDLYPQEHGLYEYIDYSTQGSGGSDQKDTWFCGNHSQTYPLYRSI